MEVVMEVSKTHEAATFLPVDPSDLLFSEGWLQETLRRYPDVLPVDEFGPVFHPLVPIGREVPTSAGSIDNLFISHSGYLVVVETKLWRNPEARREVVAQLLDYASALTHLTYDDLDSLTRDYLRKYNEGVQSLEEWVEARLDQPVDVGFQGRVSRNLKLGRFLLLIVTDQERPSVVEMLKRLSAQSWLSIDMGVVALRPFKREGDASGGLLLVPYVAGRTEIIERSSVEVTVTGVTDAQVTVRKERPDDPTPGKDRVPLTSEIAFWELMRDKAPDVEGLGRTLIEAFRGEGFELDLRESSIVVAAIVPMSEVTMPVFFLKASGKIVFWPRTFLRRARNAGVRDEAINEYVTNMLALLGGSLEKAPYCPLQQVDVRAVQELALSFQKKVAVES